MITDRLLHPFLNNLLARRVQLQAAVVCAGEAALILALAQKQGLWPWAVLVVLAVELWGLHRSEPGSRAKFVIVRVPAILMGVSAAIIIAAAPRLVTQVVVAGLFAAWRWWTSQRQEAATGMVSLLIVQAAVFEAVFLAAAVWRVDEWLVLVLVWLAAYVSVYGVLTSRGERAAGVMAATWALIAVEISWVLQRWLFVYTVNGGYLLVPQPALILTALAYCFGSIYVSQREGNLSRARLTEYLLIGLILIAIVITGTPWRGTL